MKNYLVSVVLYYSVCTFAQSAQTQYEDEDLEKQSQKAWEIYSNELKATEMSLEALNTMVNDEGDYLRLQDFELKSIDRLVGFQGPNRRVCVFESSRIRWTINFCGPLGTMEKRSWYSVVAGGITFKEPPYGKVGYFFASDGYDKNIYLIPKGVTTSKIFVLKNEDQVGFDLTSLAPPPVVQAFIQKLLSAQPLFIEKSFFAEVPE